MQDKKKKTCLYENYDKECMTMIKMMCKDCKFYIDRCTKNRTLRECSVKYLKNKE